MTDQDRISKIERSIADLEQILHELKTEVKDIKQAETSPLPETVSALPESLPVQSVQPAPEESTTKADPGIQKPATSSAVSSPAGSEQTEQVPEVVTAVPKTPSVTPKKKHSSSFEENLGGKVMGIVAAVLVFVGLFLFGTLLYERLDDIARIASLYIVSFLFLGSGLFFERKHKSWFTTSLIGCGFGALYISLFISSVYFDLFSRETLYLLLFFWLVGIGVYVFRKKSSVVALLGQTGIAFSVIFGGIFAETTGEFTFLCIFFVLLSLLYLWIVLGRFLPQAKAKAYPWIHLVAAGLNLIQLWSLALCYDSLFGDYGSIGGNNWTAGILLCLYCLLLPLFFLLRGRSLLGLPVLPRFSETRKITKETFPVYKAGWISVLFFTLLQLISWVVFSGIFGSLFEGDIPHGLLLLTGLLLSFLITELFGATGTEGRGSCIVTVVAVTFSLLIFDFPDFVHAVITILFWAVTVLAGMFGSECPVRSVLNSTTKKWEFVCEQKDGRCFEKFTSCVYGFLLLFSYQYKSGPEILWLSGIVSLLFFTGIFLFLYRKGRTHRFGDAWKNEIYLFALIHVFWILAYATDLFFTKEIYGIVLTISVLVLCNSVAFYFGFCQKLACPDKKDTGSFLIVRLVHTVLWIWGIVLLHSSGALEDHPLLCAWMVLLTLFLCGSGMYTQYKTYQKHTGLGIYFGLRVTLYTIAVMTAFDSLEGYVISCVLLCLAILAVLSGFPLRLAPLRIYGLCLAMLAVIKLLMIDVEHDNSMETVLCFLGAGILCFAINFIYNHVKKRFQNNID